MATREMTLDTHDGTVADGIVLIDFWAAWCGPCRQFAPVYEQVSEVNPDVTFAKVDTEAETELAGRYGITSIPTLVVYRDGIPVFGQPGAVPRPALEDLLTQVRGLDMDDVRAQYATQQQAEQASAGRRPATDPTSF
ncbi:MAG: thioredoxin [Actinomycetota bacterium]